MFKANKAFASFSVNDIKKARDFYSITLGVSISEEPDILRLHVSSDNTVLVYPKPDHEPASYTVLNFPVKNIEEAVQELSGEGIKFEQYDFDGIKTDADGIFRSGGPLIAWFKDPAGNILSVLQE